MRNTILAQAFFASKKNHNPTNIYETDEKYLIDIEAPYFTENDITIKRIADGIHVKGEKEIELPEPFKAGNSNTRKLNRHIHLRENFDNEDVKATLADGVLHIAIVKQPAKNIPIKVS